MRDVEFDEASVRAAYARQLAGERLSREDAALLKRWEKAEGVKARWEAYRAVPKVDYRALSGRQDKVLKEQAKLWNLAIGGAEVDLEVVIHQFHDILAKWGRRAMRQLEEEDLLIGGPKDSRELERLRRAKADLAELELAAKRKEMLPRSEVREGLLRVAAIYKNRGEAWERAFGPTMKQELERLNDEAVDEIKRMFPEARLPDDDE